MSFYGFPPPHSGLFGTMRSDTQSVSIFYLSSNGLEKGPQKERSMAGSWERTI